MSDKPALYPLKFHPILKDKIWGGKRISNLLNKPAGNECGESWEISGIPDSVSVVTNGSLTGRSLEDLCKKYETEFLGSAFKTFPLLIKFIDANEDLSIQVHPNDEQNAGNGKSEMWYIIEAEKDATLLCGFNRSTNLPEVRDSIDEGHFDELLNRVSVKAGDAFYIPSGTVHTIGKGILLAEIQQSSDTTYRIYDFDRIDNKGNKRELHIDESLSVMNLDRDNGLVTTNSETLLSCPFFVTHKLSIQTKKTLKADDGFRIYINVSGKSKISFGSQSWSLNFGETCLLPSGLEMEIEPEGDVILLETYVRNGD
ncbi:MAG: mannose-6-phosphate isomerase [Cytophagales bacterium]|nr:mannose-6-phosphate isomerase [Cytophagales bacterium]